MATPTRPEAIDRLGGPLPVTPSTADIERGADRLRIVPEVELSPDAVNRVGLDELEQRRLRALGR